MKQSEMRLVRLAEMTEPRPHDKKAINLLDSSRFVYRTVSYRQIACYVLIKNGIVAYVGRSKNVWRRLGSHQRKNSHTGIEWDTAYVLMCDEQDLDELEKALIRLLDPLCNVKSQWLGSPDVALEYLDGGIDKMRAEITAIGNRSAGWYLPLNENNAGR